MLNDYVEHFYSTTFETKVARLAKMASDTETIDLRSLANEISDGCGGCEQLIYGDVSGMDYGTLVSVLWSNDGETTYVRVDTDSHSNVERIALLATRMPSQQGWSEDALETYLFVLSTYQWRDLGDDDFAQSPEGRLRARVGIGPREQWPAYAWPGGYPILYITDDGETLCAACMNDASNPVHFSGHRDGWRVDAVDIDQGSGELVICAHCGAVIVADGEE